jgi:hypothetical protein
MFIKRVSRINIEPVCSARLAAARLRRALYGHILAPPPVRAIQTLCPLESGDKRTGIVLNEKEKLVYKGANYWLVLNCTSLAGFKAPIDSLANGFGKDRV